MFQPAYAGQFLRDQARHTNLNSVINQLLTESRRLAFSATIARLVKFPDASFYQKEIDFNLMKQNTKAIIIRAGQNLWIDDQFERNYAEAVRVGLLKGLYWFYDDRVSPGKQAELLISLLENKSFEMEAFIDWETSYGGSYKGLQNVVAMMQVIESAKPKIKDVGIYTGYYFFRGNSNPITNAGQYNYLKNKPLWEAWYTSNPANVLIPAPWTSIKHWQFGTPVVSWGQKTKELDMNFFNGSEQEFQNSYGGTLPPTGGTMQVIQGTAKGSVKIRQSPAGLEFSPPRYLASGDQIEASENSAQWLHLTKINGREITDSEWASAGTSQQYISWKWVDVPTEPPPPPPPATKKIVKSTLLFDDNSEEDLFPVA